VIEQQRVCSVQCATWFTSADAGPPSRFVQRLPKTPYRAPVTITGTSLLACEPSSTRTATLSKLRDAEQGDSSRPCLLANGNASSE